MVGTTTKDANLTPGTELPKVDNAAPPTENNKGAAPVYDLTTMKKKKKKKPKVDPEATAGSELAASVAALGSGGSTDLPAVEDIDLNANAEAEEAVVDFPAPDFSLPKKRWRKPKVVFDDEEVSTRVVRRAQVVQPWDGTTRDYTYSELINRAFQFLHGKNPALAGETRGKKKISLQLPQVAREGTKKTVFMNFGAICKSIHRQQDHLLQYMGAELGTTGNIQDGGRLVIKGRFTGESIVKVLKRYMSEYVICTSCRSPDTVLMRDANTRLYFVSCESCGAKRSVAPIRQGFMAQVERRKRT